MSSIKLDLHLHTVYSKDSLIKPDDLIIQAKKKGLNGFAITDHGNLKAYKILAKKYKNKDIIIIPGMEIKTNIGEVIGLFISDEIDVKDKNFFTIVQNIKDNNGLVVIPHPFDFLRNNRLKIKLLDNNIIEKYVDGIEIMNSRIIFKSCIKKAMDFNNKHHLFETGGSDAHTKKEIGVGFTIIRDITENSLENIRNSLLAKKSKSAGKLSSPLVHVRTVCNKIVKGVYF